MKIVRLLIMLAILLCLPAWGLTQNEELKISQVYQAFEDDSKLHVRLESPDNSTSLLTIEGIEQATVGTRTLPVEEVYSVSSERFTGMRYVFVLDHAMPISAQRVAELKKGMNEWIAEMGSGDAAAIFVVEEDSVRALTDGFIADKDRLHDAVEHYGEEQKRASKSMLFSGIRDAIVLAAQEDESLPQGCSIVVCSDGLDTYQTLVTAEEISAMLAQNNLPLYVVGYAYQAQKEALAGLVNMAKRSGGWVEDATPSNDGGKIDEAFAALHRRIQAGVEIVLDGSDGCKFNGSTQIAIRFHEPPIMSRYTADLYLVREAKTEEKIRESLTRREEKQIERVLPPVEEAPEKERVGTPKKEDPKVEYKKVVHIAAGALFAAVLAAVILLMIRKPKKKQEEIGGTIKQMIVRVKRNDKEDSDILDFIINGDELRKPLTIGSKNGNQIRINSTTIAGKHAEITCRGNRVYVKNVSESGNPVFVGAQPLNRNEQKEIENDGNMTLGSYRVNVYWYHDDKEVLTVRDPKNASRQAVNSANDLTRRPDQYAERHEFISDFSVMLKVTYILNGQEITKIIDDARNITIGREFTDTVRINDISVSRHHVRLVKDENEYIWIKNDSIYRAGYGKNPFFCNGKPVLDQKLFENGMTIQLGDIPVTIDAVAK